MMTVNRWSRLQNPKEKGPNVHVLTIHRYHQGQNVFLVDLRLKIVTEKIYMLRELTFLAHRAIIVSPGSLKNVTNFFTMRKFQRSRSVLNASSVLKTCQVLIATGNMCTTGRNKYEQKKKLLNVNRVMRQFL